MRCPRWSDFKIDPEKKPWACTGWKPGDDPEKRGVINSIYIDTESLSEHNAVLQAMYAEVTKNEKMWGKTTTAKAQSTLSPHSALLLVSQSLLLIELKAEGINVGLVRPITVWPFPYEAVAEAANADGVKAVLDVELNEGQMIEDVKIAVNGAKPIDFFGHCGSQMPTTDEIVAKIESMKEGK